METQVEERIQRLPLPTGKDNREHLLKLVRTALGLNRVKELLIDGNGVTLTRFVPPGTDAWPVETQYPDDSDLVDYGFIMHRIELQELETKRCSFPPEAFQEAAERLGNQVVGFLFPPGELGPAYFGIEGAPTRIFGYPVLYGTEATTKIVVVGGPTHFWSEAREGVVIDVEALGL